jgi:hypothetical protein
VFLSLLVIPGNGSADRKGQEMIGLRFAVPAVLAAAVVAGCFTYFAAPSGRIETDPPLRPAMRSSTDRLEVGASLRSDHQPGTEQKAATAYHQAAEAILRRAQSVQANVGAEVPPITGPVPLPRKRPLPRP